MLKDAPEATDLLVIGGGINGCGVARDAAGRGLSVVMCEKDDLAEGTSSRSGKYIHGGLRYLEYYEFRLVREALIEREVVLAAAPHLAWPLRLILPHSRQQRPRWLIRLGLFLYDHLGGRKRVPGTKAVDLRRDPVGDVVQPGFTKAFAYYDVWCDDARLTLMNAVDAKRKGAHILTRTECVSAEREGDQWRITLRDTLSGESRVLTARAIFNAAGPWVETVLSGVARVNSQFHVRLVKGSHIIMKRWWQGDHGYVLQAHDKRLIFVNPYFDDLALIGTTDIPFEGRPEDVTIEPDEVDYLLGILNRYFETALQPDDVLHSYSGVRPLYDDDAEKNASAVTRDYTFELDGGEGRAPLLSAFGGKITTFRKLSEHGLQKLKPFLPEMGGDWTETAPLPGGEMEGADFEKWFEGFRARHGWLPEPLARHYARNFGTDAEAMLEGIDRIEGLGRHFGALCYQRELDWLIAHEWALTAADLLERRTRHGLFLSPEQRDAVGEYVTGATAMCRVS